MKLVLVDGHNLIFQSRRLSEILQYESGQASREEAERWILRWAEKAGEVRVLLVYDGKTFPGGHPGNRDEGPLRVRYTDPPAEADDRIVYEAERAAGRYGRITVVTDDRTLRGKARAAGAETEEVAAFLRELGAPPEETPKEARFTAEEADALAREMLRRPAPPAVSGPALPRAPRRPARDEAPAAPAPAKKTPPSPPGREERRERYAGKMKRKAASRGKRPSRSRKKRRGY